MKLLVTIVTPFDAQGRVDLAHLRAHILWLASQGVDGFIATAGSGELLYLSAQERADVHRTVLDTVRDQVVYPCTWHPSPTTTRHLTEAAAAQGATGIMMPPPLFYELNDTVVNGWYTLVRSMTDLAVFAASDPALSPTRIATKTYQHLRERSVVSGLIDGSQDVYRLQRLCRDHPDTVYAMGDRILGEVAQLEHCAGVVSEMANVWPQFCRRVLTDESDLDAALRERVKGLRDAGGFRAVKTLLRMGCRSPLGPADRRALDRLAPAEI